MKHYLKYILLLLTTPLFGQEADKPKEKNWGISFHGFVKTDFWFDSRQVSGSREDLFALYPLNLSLDKNGKDVNEKSYVNFSAITSRIIGNISGPDALNAKSSGVIEADFSGNSNSDVNGFWLRQAYLKLNWGKSELLLGQYWHPMFVTEVFPSVISLNTGAPFQPFIRNPQFLFTHKFGKIKLIMAVLTQRDYVNEGPSGKSSIYIRNAAIPNLHLQLQYKNELMVYGIAGDYKWLQPELVTDSSFKTHNKIGTYGLMAYYKYEKEKLCIKFKTILGQNLTEHLLLGGYAVKSINESTAEKTYTPLNHLFLWGNVLFGERVKFGIFGGYAINLGSSDPNIGIYYCRGADIDYLYRIAPSCSWISEKTQISCELEYTVAAYGTPGDNGKAMNSKEIGNIRILCTVFYFF